jgi:hypothetical protein
MDGDQELAMQEVCPTNSGSTIDVIIFLIS